MYRERCKDSLYKSSSLSFSLHFYLLQWSDPFIKIKALDKIREFRVQPFRSKRRGGTCFTFIVVRRFPPKKNSVLIRWFVMPSKTMSGFWFCLSECIDFWSDFHFPRLILFWYDSVWFSSILFYTIFNIFLKPTVESMQSTSFFI